MRLPRKLKKKYKKEGLWWLYKRSFDHNGECFKCDRWFSDCICD